MNLYTNTLSRGALALVLGLAATASAPAASFEVAVVDFGGPGSLGAPLTVAGGTIDPPLPGIVHWEGPIGFSGIAIAPKSGTVDVPDCTPAGCHFTPATFGGTYFKSPFVSSGTAPSGADGIFIMGLYGGFTSLSAGQVYVYMQDSGGLENVRLELDGGNGTAADGTYDLDQQYRLRSFALTDREGNDYVELWVVNERLTPVGTFGGLTHRSLGRAILATDYRGQLVLSNIGASGEDGVEIDLGRAAFSRIQYDTPPVAEMDEECEVIIHTDGELDQEKGVQSIWSITMQARPRQNAWEVSVDTSRLQPAVRTVDAYLGGVLVASASAPAGGLDFAFRDEPVAVRPFHNITFCEPIINCIGPGAPEFCHAEFFFARPTTVTLPDRRRVTADLAIFASSQQRLTIHHLTGTRMNLRNVPTATIRREQVGVLETSFTAVGDGTLAPDLDRLTVSNIGATGDDGVDLEPLDSFAAFANGLYTQVQPVDLSAPGATIMAECVVEDSFGIFDNPVGGCMNTPQGITGFVDFGELPCEDVVVTLFCTDGPTMTKILPEGNLFRVDRISGKAVPQIDQMACLGDELLVLLNNDATITFLDGSGDMCQANGVSLEATTCARPRGIDAELIALELRAAVMDELVVENVTIGNCRGDLDGDGAVAFGDVLAVLSAWGPCGGCPEDIDGSGVVDFGDILALLSAWGPCP